MHGVWTFQFLGIRHIKSDIGENVGYVLGTESGSVTFICKDCENCRGCTEKYWADEEHDGLLGFQLDHQTVLSEFLATEEHSDPGAKEQASGKAACIREESSVRMPATE